MNDLQRNPSEKSLVTLTHAIYALHAFAVFSAVAGSATIVLSFVASIPSLLAVILNYWNRAAVRGTWLESHFRWQIRTFWFGLLWVCIASLFILTIVGIPVALVIFGIAGLWVLYRVVRGWWVLFDQRPLPLN